MAAKLSGKVAVVTGASKGIGAQIAKDLAAAGASVVVNYASSKSGGDKVVAEITKAGGKAVAIGADVSKPEQIKKLFDETIKSFGKLDILVNNAGVYEMSPLDEITPQNFHKMFDLNVLGLLLTTQEAVRRFGDAGGSIINISSVVVSFTPPAMAIYTATKASVDAITRVLAKELGSKKIRVNAISPGMVDTEGARSAGYSTNDSEFRKHLETQTPLGRIGMPDDISPAAVFLASDDSKWITGEMLTISGGLR